MAVVLPGGALVLTLPFRVLWHRHLGCVAREIFSDFTQVPSDNAKKTTNQNLIVSICNLDKKRTLRSTKAGETLGLPIDPLRHNVGILDSSDSGCGICSSFCHKVFRVSVEDENHINLMHELASTSQIDFWKPDSISQIKLHSTVDFHVKAEDVDTVEDFLEQNELYYEVLISNLRSMMEAQFDSHGRATGHSYTKYNSWETIEAWTQQVAAQNPDLISRSVIGTTFEGRSMYLLKVGKAKPNKPAIFIDCGFHAREWISPAFCQWFVREAVRTYGQEIQMTELLDKSYFYILPVFNIDGYVYTWTKDRMWRKTRSTQAGTSCIGTDPNRNFNAGWCENGASTSPCSDTYCGSAPESEKETKALANFIQKNLSSIKAYLTIHSYSQLLLYPYSYSYKLPQNNAELNALAKAAVKELASLHGTKYTYGPGATTIYLAAGGSDDWAYDQGIKYSFTFELRDTGKYGFLLPESQIRATCEETILAVKHIASYVLGHLY
ncbi:Carboxypeptidase B [Heterocephalus glaber]|uniref:Carboxypeptidase B n=1 Tax=Heterocephalus glaber TaxID=10181 RepID=G5BSK3_HETGA|nr:Carboxypeptidase B [Heterocephalus glaber]